MNLDDFLKYMRRPKGPAVPPSDPLRYDESTGLGSYALWCVRRQQAARVGSAASVLVQP